MRAWRANNKAWEKEYRRDYYGKNHEQMLFNHAKERAKNKGLPFALAVADVVIPPFCPVLGIPLVRGKGQPTSNSPSIDRIIPDKGYVKGNIIVVSHRVNSIKRDATIDELRLISDFYRKLACQHPSSSLPVSSSSKRRRKARSTRPTS